MDTHQLSTERKMGQDRNKEKIKAYLKLNENEHRAYPNLCDTKIAAEKAHSTKYLCKIDGEISYYILHSTPENSIRKRNNYTQAE